MDDKTLAALHGSIAKWQAIVDGTGKNEGARNCPLCKLFLLLDPKDNDGWERRAHDEACVGCPVYEKTGHIRCEGTPYEFYESLEELEDEDDHNGNTLAQLALDELAFLKSLVPA